MGGEALGEEEGPSLSRCRIATMGVMAPIKPRRVAAGGRIAPLFVPREVRWVGGGTAAWVGVVAEALVVAGSRRHRRHRHRDDSRAIFSLEKSREGGRSSVLESREGGRSSLPKKGNADVSGGRTHADDDADDVISIVMFRGKAVARSEKKNKNEDGAAGVPLAAEEAIVDGNEG